MDKLKGVILIETIIIITLAILLIITAISLRNTSYVIDKVPYCSKHFYDDQVRLLSPKIYTGILPANNFLILNFKPLEKQIQEYMVNNNLNFSIYVQNLRDGASFGINEEQGYEPASLNKLPIAIILLKKVEDKKLNLDSILPILDRDRDSQSGTLYSEPINEMKVKDLLYRMLAESDNTALKVLEEQITLEDLQHLSSYLDYYTQDVDYIPPYDNNYQVTPQSIGNLFSSLYLSTDLKPEHSEMILSYLQNSTFDIKKYANLSEDVVVAQKYASYYTSQKSLFHDCGIIYMKDISIKDNRIFYCIMTQNLSEENAPEVIGKIVNKIYNYVYNVEINDLGV